MNSTHSKLEEAQWVLDEMAKKSFERNWIIVGYTLTRYSGETLEFYYEMQRSGVNMDQLTDVL